MSDRAHRFSIKKWPEGERPREKLIQFGAEALSDAELLAILLRVGNGRVISDQYWPSARAKRKACVGY